MVSSPKWYILNMLLIPLLTFSCRPAKKHKSKKRSREDKEAITDKEDMIKHGIKI